MFANRIGNRGLSILCDRVSVAFDVGHDPHKIFKREGESLNRAYGSRMRQIAAMVENGGTLAEALRRQGNYFPPDFVHMIEVGERTGRLEVVLERLGLYYKDLADLRTEFINSIVWPVIQVCIAIIVIACMIYFPAVLAPDAGDAVDMLGIGLTGPRGLSIFLLWVAFGLAAIVAIYVAARNGAFSFLAGWVAHIPFFRRFVIVFAEARFVQTLALALESGLDTWNSVEMAFRSAGSPLFSAKAERTKNAIRQGRELHVALSETALLSRETIEAVQLGEDAGRLAETLDKQFRFLRVEVKSTMTKLTYFASSLIWAAIAAILILVIFRVFSNYLQNMESAGGSVVNRAATISEQK